MKQSKRAGHGVTLALTLLGLSSAIAVLLVYASATTAPRQIPSFEAPVTSTDANVLYVRNFKDVCYIDPPYVYTYENISLANISEEWKRWFAFEGSMSYEERQAFLNEYYSNMTEEERRAIWNMVCSAPETAASV